jgi:hypothetical protein
MSYRWLVLAVLPALTVASRADDTKNTSFQPPVKVAAGGKPIDLGGPAAPYLGDLKSDGVLSLLIGQSDGKLRVYRNTVTETGAQPKFDQFTLFQDGKASGAVPASADVGFTPKLLKRGDAADLFSGSATGELSVFRGKDKGEFGAREVLRDKALAAITVPKAATVFAADWRGGGKLDLIVGTLDGYVYLVPNDGADGKDVYGKPKRLEVDGKPIQVSMGRADPVVADWDGDGKPDLIVGTGAGSVVWFQNAGTREEPKLGAAQTLVSESPLAANPNAVLKDGQGGLQAKVCVVDWNGDGKLDLLVGDSVVIQKAAPPVGSTPQDRAAEKKLRDDKARMEKDYNALLQKEEALSKPVGKETPKALQERQKKIEEVKRAAAKLQQDQLDAEKQMARLSKPAPVADPHGYVWLYLRK